MKKEVGTVKRKKTEITYKNMITYANNIIFNAVIRQLVQFVYFYECTSILLHLYNI